MKLGYTCVLRSLIPISVLLIILPIIFPEYLLNMIFIPMFYSIGSFIVFLNFPKLGEVLYEKPLYLDDLVIITGNDRNHNFRRVYTTIMNFILSGLVAVFAEYAMVKGVTNKTPIEIMAIIGGIIALYMKTQGVVGKVLLKICHLAKERELHRRLSETHVEMKQIDVNPIREQI